MNHEPESLGFIDASEFSAGAPASGRDAFEIWSALLSRSYKVAGVYVESGVQHLLLERAPGTTPPLTPRNRSIFERTLLGDDRKAIAAECGVSTSTVAHVLRLALKERGLDCTPARAPLVLVMIVQAAHRELAEDCLWLRRGGAGEDERLLLSTNLEPSAWAALAPAERAVVSERLLGRSYADIAAGRHTSRRTVANQMASVHRRSGKSGRSCLLQWIFGAATPAA
ncbi:MAG TPA: hypothetical protein VMI54_23070 [Polyangiaceae bacterium]|nr:hypothetical protein [Polyangiaceae bacterium]